MRSPMRPTSSSSRRFPHSTTSSSPPRRATVSALRERSESLRQPVHQGGPVREPGHRVVQDLVSESLLRLDLCRHVAGNAERADDLAALIAKRHLCRRDPGTGSAVECLPLQLPHHRLTGADDLLLVLKSSGSVFLAEEVEVSLPDYLLHGTVRGCRGHP